jgi:putative membrane protein
MKEKDLIIILGVLFFIPGFLHAGMMGFGLPIWIIVLAVVYFVLKEKSDDSSLEELKKRYARGEITREEYIRKKEEITKP